MSTHSEPWLSPEQEAALAGDPPEIEPAPTPAPPANGNGAAHLRNPFTDEPPEEGETTSQRPVVALRPLISGEGLKVPEYVVDGLIERGSYTLLYGRWGVGKSQVVMDWALRVALGLPVQGRQVKPGPVVLVAGEGHRGLEKRALAWSSLHGEAVQGCRVLVTEAPVQLGIVEQLCQLRDAITAHAHAHWDGEMPALIVSDTLATNSGLGDENDNAVMSDRMALMKALLYGPMDAAFIELHHPGKAQDRGPRGASALQGNADIVLELVQDANTPELLELSATKTKDVARPKPYLYRIHPVPLRYPDGVDRTSPAVDEEGEGTVQRAPSEPEKPVGGNMREFLLAMRDVQRTNEERVMEQGRHPEEAWVSVGQLNAACRSRVALQQARAPYLNKLREAALERGYLKSSSGGDLRLGNVHL